MVVFSRIECSLLFEKAVVPHFPEALIRGGLGFTMRRKVCLTGKESCADCVMADKCLFGIMFDTQTKTHDARQVSPYSIFCTMDAVDPRRMIVEFTFFQPLLDFADHIVALLRLAGTSGIGENRNRFVITGISEPLSGRVLATDSPIVPAVSGWVFPESVAAGEDIELTLDFVSATRLQRFGALVMEPSFTDIIKGCVFRYNSLSRAYHPEEPAFESFDWSPLAANSRVVSCATTAVDKKRYSERQKQEVRAGGFTGSVRFAGQLDGFLPLLEFGSVAGIGKNTTFGCGRFVIRY